MHLLTDANYQPNAMTPLYDAIGYATAKLRVALEGHYTVLCGGLTDGAENASEEYTRQTIANIIKQLENKDWVFTFMGTNKDVAAEAGKVFMTNTVVFSYSEKRVNTALQAEKYYLNRFYEKVKEGNKDKKMGSLYRNLDKAPKRAQWLTL